MFTDLEGIESEVAISERLGRFFRIWGSRVFERRSLQELNISGFGGGLDYYIV